MQNWLRYQIYRLLASNSVITANCLSLSNDPHKKESTNGNARWNVNFFIVTTSDLIGLDSKTAKKLRFKVHFV